MLEALAIVGALSIMTGVLLLFNISTSLVIVLQILRLEENKLLVYSLATTASIFLYYVGMQMLVGAT